jgi:hypothetical protein
LSIAIGEINILKVTSIYLIGIGLISGLSTHSSKGSAISQVFDGQMQCAIVSVDGLERQEFGSIVDGQRSFLTENFIVGARQLRPKNVLDQICSIGCRIECQWCDSNKLHEERSPLDFHRTIVNREINLSDKRSAGDTCRDATKR